MEISVNSGVFFFFFGLVETAVCAENCQIKKRWQNKMTAVFQLYSKTQLLESFIKLLLDRNFVHCSPISL